MRKLLVGIMLLVPLQTWGQNEIDLGEIVVTPLKTESRLTQSAGQTISIGEKQLEEQNAYSLGEGLTSYAGLDVVGGGAFQSSSLGVYIRGGQPRHTAYLFDGLKIYDPSNPSAYYVPYDLTVPGAQKIEIVKFPLSSLYGSSPLAGAVNILPKRPKSGPYVTLDVGGGSHETSREILEVGGKLENFSYLLNAARIDTEGFSRSRGEPEPDGYQNTDVTLNLEHSVPDDIEAGFSAKAIRSRSDLDDDDDFDGLPEDDLDSVAWNTEFFPTLYLAKHITPELDYKMQTGYTSIYRKYRDGGEDSVRGWYKGQTYQVGTHLQWRPRDFTTTIIGWDYTREKMDGYLFNSFVMDTAKVTGRTNGIFIEEVFTPREDLSLDFSLRREHHPYFSDPLILKTGATYTLLEQTDLFFSYGEGFKAPSLYQLHDPYRGNTSLEPEKSESWQAGLTHRFNDRLSCSTLYFHSNFENLIDFVLTDINLFLGSFRNAAKSRSRGVETNITYRPTEHIRLEGGYVYLKGEQDFVDTDFATVFKHSLIRVPRHKAYAKIGYESDPFSAYVDVNYAGSRFDRIWVGSFPVEDVFAAMEPYVLVNASCNYQLNDTASLWFKINNILDKDYERLKGYQEEPRSLYGGIKFSF